MKKIIIIAALSFLVMFPFGRSIAQSNIQNRDYSLYQNSPNPFAEVTNVKFFLKSDCFVKLYVTEIRTGKVTMLAEGEMTAGEHGVMFKAMSIAGGSSESYTEFICTMETYAAEGDILLHTSEIKMIQN